MACNVKINSLNNLKNKGISDTNNIVSDKNITLFNDYNEKTTKLAELKYGLETNNKKLLNLEKININSNLVVPNENLFDNLQKLVDNYKPFIKETNNKLPELTNKLKNWLSDNGFKINLDVENLTTDNGTKLNAQVSLLNKTIDIAKNKEHSLTEEAAHIIIESLGNDNVLIQSAFKELNKFNYKDALDFQYVSEYSNNENKLKKEYLAKVLAETIGSKESLQKNNRFLSIIRKIKEIFISKFGNVNQKALLEIERLSKKIVDENLYRNLNSDNLDASKEIYYQINEKAKKEKSKYEKQVVFLKQKLKSLYKELAIIDKKKNPEEFTNKFGEIETLKRDITEIEKTDNRAIILDLGKKIIEEMTYALEDFKVLNEKPSARKIDEYFHAIEVFKQFEGLANDALTLERELKPLFLESAFNNVAELSDKNYEDIEEDYNTTQQDINRYKKNFGTLTSVNNILARTIAKMIKFAQSKISRKNKEVYNEIQEETDLLKEYQKSQGISENKIFDIFIQNYGKTTVLVKPFISNFYNELSEAFKNLKNENPIIRNKGKKWLQEFTVKNTEGKIVPKHKEHWNTNFEKIQNTPELKRYYDFYQKIMAQNLSKLPVNTGLNFIPNIVNSLIEQIKHPNKTRNLMGIMKDNLKESLKVQTLDNADVLWDESLFVDGLNFNKFVKALPTEQKSTDLSASLLKFSQWANQYEEMTEILPRLRLLEAAIKEQTFKQSSSPTKKTEDGESNVSKMVKEVIEMQVLGKTKKEEGQISIGKNEDGKEQFVLGSVLGDIMLSYNSILRIAFSPIGALSNVITGEINNITEASGGKNFTLKGLNQASKLLVSERNKYLALKDKINPLQEIEDYESYDKLRLTKSRITLDKIKNLGYILQQKGEEFLQGRVFIAMMLKQKININGKEISVWEAFDENGKLKKEVQDVIGSEEIFIDKLTTKIKEVNNSIHGRYSARDAAIIQKELLGRAILQFRKWIPAMFEARWEGKSYNDILETTTEGKYRTFLRLMSENRKELRNFLIGKSNLSEFEIANLRKIIAGNILFTTMLILASAIRGDDDDEERLKQPEIKFALTLLDRASNDMLYFLNPQSPIDLGQQAIPLAKLAGDLYRTGKYLPYILEDKSDKDAYYRSGRHKGQNKFWSNARRSIPFIAPTQNVLENFNDSPYFKPNK